MRCFPRSARWLSAIALVMAVSSPSTAEAALFEVDWDFDLGFDTPDPNPTAFWDCPGAAAGGLICRYLWEQGLEVRSNNDLPMYDAGGPFYDAFGVDLSDALLRIEASCRDGEAPCFKTFTPLRLNTSFFSDDPGVGLFVQTDNGSTSTSSEGWLDFTDWGAITFMEIGLSLPDSCSDPDEPECGHGEQALYINRLVFEAQPEPVPEPTPLALLGAALLVRRLRARSSRI